MTAISARFHEGPASLNRAVVSRMLAAMASRGSDHRHQFESDRAALGASWYEWEQRIHGPTHDGLVVSGPFAIVADATLYHRDDLRRVLAANDTRANGDSSAALIVAAYAAFGDACVAHLAGDFAFVIWDDARRRFFAARDFVGKRSLHFAEHRTGLSLASTVIGLLADDAIAFDLNLAAVAAKAAGMWEHTNETCYRAIKELPAGFTLAWEPGQRATVARFWSPPAELARDNRPMDVAAAELRGLLIEATDQRMDSGGPTVVALSGGWDSTAIFGAAQHVLRTDPQGRSIRAVSMSYPEGDPGREDELIRQVVDFWGTETAWIDIADAPMMPDERAAVRTRVEPWTHPYENWNRAVARGAAGLGARVIFDGSGGDQLFQVSDVFLSDLFRSGRWVQLARQWRARGGVGLRNFVRWAVRPALSKRTQRWMAAARGMQPPPHYLDRALPFWFKADFVRTHGLVEREMAARPVLPTSSAVLAETHLYLLYQYFPRITSHLFDFGLSEGVEYRSPLLDARVVDFAVRRPWYERAAGNETKILLRRAVRGLVPDAVLAPRPHRTGGTSGYFASGLKEAGQRLMPDVLRESVLASTGMINVDSLRRAWEFFLTTDDEGIGTHLYFTLVTELWMRERQGVRT